MGIFIIFNRFIRHPFIGPMSLEVVKFSHQHFIRDDSQEMVHIERKTLNVFYNCNINRDIKLN